MPGGFIRRLTIVGEDGLVFVLLLLLQHHETGDRAAKFCSGQYHRPIVSLVCSPLDGGEHYEEDKRNKSTADSLVPLMNYTYL